MAVDTSTPTTPGASPGVRGSRHHVVVIGSGLGGLWTAEALAKACGPENERLREAGPERAGQFTWAACAEKTLDVYRAVHQQHEGGRSRGGRGRR